MHERATSMDDGFGRRRWGCIMADFLPSQGADSGTEGGVL